MIEHIEIDTFVKFLGDNTGGVSRPVQVIGSNGKEYLLKNQNVYNTDTRSWETWDCMFLQEALVHNIARHMGITLPDFAVANVERIFLQNAPALTFEHRYVPGYHFASSLIEGVENNLRDGYQELIALGKPYIKRSWTTFFNNIANREDVAKIIVLDLLTANFDRFGNLGNLIIASNNGERLMYCIDHGHCFYGAQWASVTKKRMMLHVSPDIAYINEYSNFLLQSSNAPMSGLGEIFRALDSYIDVSENDNHCFHDIVLHVEDITPDLIDNWFHGIPDEWYVDKVNQIAQYKYFIMNQKNLLRVFLDVLAHNKAFHSHLGGNLGWNVGLTGTP